MAECVIACTNLTRKFGELTAVTMRTGGDVLYDRPVWQDLYHS